MLWLLLNINQDAKEESKLYKKIQDQSSGVTTFAPSDEVDFEDFLQTAQFQIQQKSNK